MALFVANMIVSIEIVLPFFAFIQFQNSMNKCLLSQARIGR